MILKILAGVFSLVIFLLGVQGFVIEPSGLLQKDLKVNKWQGPPLRIAFFSDLHAGSPYIYEDYIRDLIKRINEQSPDIILIGGDFAINNVFAGHPISIDIIAQLLKELKAPLGVYAVLGNHDWWNDTAKIRKSLELNQIQVLENSARLITLQSGFNFWLVGIGDSFTNHANIPLALGEVNTEDPQILFMHDPAALFEVKSKYFLALAGHLHGGQVYIPGFGAIITPGKAPRSWADGWVDLPMGSLFVSRGIGTSILPVRLNAPPEFVILDLNK